MMIALVLALILPAAHAAPSLAELRAAYVRAYNTGDIEAIATMYADSAVRMPYDSPAERGKAAIVAGARRSFAGRHFRPTLELIADGSIERGDVTVERGTYHETQNFADGSVRHED